MNKNGKRYKEEQIIYALRQVEGGRKIAKVCRAAMGNRNDALDCMIMALETKPR